MPLPALLLLGFFLLVAVLAAVVAVAAVGPRRPAALVVPALVAIATLWGVGHRSGMSVGPTVELFGFEVNLLFDLAAALVGALIAAYLQCLTLGRLAARRGRRPGAASGA